MPRLVTSAALLATAAAAAGSSLGSIDAVAMLQQESLRSAPVKPARTIEEALAIFSGTTPEPPLPQQAEYDEGMRWWLKSFYSLLRVKGDKAVSECCELGKRQLIVPYKSWGDASEEEQHWWEENNCNFLTGDDNPDEPAGMPNCPQESVLAKMLPPQDPQPFASLNLERTDGQGFGRSGPGCDEEDRQELNASYTDRTRLVHPSDHCQEFYIIRDGVQWNSLVPCISEMYGITFACSRCYVNFLEDLGGNNKKDDKGCFQKCMGLGACRVTEDCGYFINECAQCLQPAIQSYNGCLGGPTYNALTLQKVFEEVIMFKSAQ